MGLDSYVATFDGHSYNIELDSAVKDLFIHLPFYSFQTNTISFQGKAYSDFIRKVTGYSLYSDLKWQNLKEMHEALESYIERNNLILKKLQCLQDTCWINDNSYDFDAAFNDWLSETTGTSVFFMGYENIRHISTLFKICADNELYLYASY